MNDIVQAPTDALKTEGCWRLGQDWASQPITYICSVSDTNHHLPPLAPDSIDNRPNPNYLPDRASQICDHQPYFSGGC